MFPKIRASQRALITPGEGNEDNARTAGIRRWGAASLDLAFVGVRGEAADGGDPGLHRDVLAVDAQRGRAVLERPAARPRRLVADEEHGGPFVGEPSRQVVQDAPAGGHAAGGDDDGLRQAFEEIAAVTQSPFLVQVGDVEREQPDGEQ